MRPRLNRSGASMRNARANRRSCRWRSLPFCLVWRSVLLLPLRYFQAARRAWNRRGRSPSAANRSSCRRSSEPLLRRQRSAGATAEPFATAPAAGRGRKPVRFPVCHGNRRPPTARTAAPPKQSPPSRRRHSLPFRRPPARRALPSESTRSSSNPLKKTWVKISQATIRNRRRFSMDYLYPNAGRSSSWRALLHRGPRPHRDPDSQKRRADRLRRRASIIQ